MATLATFRMQREEIPSTQPWKRVAESVPPGQELEVVVRTVSAPAKSDCEREEALIELDAVLAEVDAKADLDGFTQEDADKLLNEADNEDNQERLESGLPARDPKHPTSVTNW